MGHPPQPRRPRPLHGVPVTLDDAADRYRTAAADHDGACAAQQAAHAAHLATMPLVGRLRLGNGSEATRKAHHAACTAVADTRAELHTARDELVAAALAHECVS